MTLYLLLEQYPSLKKKKRKTKIVHLRVCIRTTKRVFVTRFFVVAFIGTEKKTFEPSKSEYIEASEI